MFILLCVSAVLLPFSFGANTVDECFDKASSCQVDDSKYPPYNTFTNQLDANACKRACLDQNDKGILVADGGSKAAKFCQLAVSRPGICKLYYQTGIETGGSSGRRKRGSYGPNQPVQQQYQPQQQQYQPQQQGNYGGNQGGNQWGPRNQQGNGDNFGPRTQGGYGGNQGGSGGDQCWTLKSGCPGYGGVGAGGNGTGNGTANTTAAPAGANAKCFINNLKDKGVRGNAIIYLLGSTQFDETLDGCEAKCMANKDCKSINFFEITPLDPGECVLHSDTCKIGTPPSEATDNCIMTVKSPPARDDIPTVYWERKPGCTA